MTKPEPIYFCWFQGGKEPSCCLIYGLDQNINSHGKQKVDLLQKHELPTEYKDLSLVQLSMIYPYNGVTK